MEWILLITGVVFIFIVSTKVGTWIRFSFHFVCTFNKLQGIEVINLDGSKARLIMVLGALLTLPNNVLALMKKKEIIIIYSKQRELFVDGNYAGLFNGEDNFIFVWDDGLHGNWGWQVTTILHEVGHFVDYCIGYNHFLSCIDTNLHNIYDGEHKYYERYKNGSYYTNNILEYFAQSFAEFFLVKGFKKQCPDTAQYVECVLATI